MRKLFCLVLKIFITIIFITSCKEKNNGSLQVIEIINNINNFKSFTLNNLECNLEYVVLETTPDAMLMDIRFLDLSEEYIVVSDRDKCLLFERNGNFISKIGRQGRGPGENTYFTLVKIFNDKIFLPDGLTHIINIFNTEGEFINSLKSPGEFWGLNSNNWMVLTDSSYLVQIPNHTGTEKIRIAMINNNGEILKKYANTTFFTSYDSSRCRHNRQSYFYKHETNVFFKDFLNDTIWQINGDHLNPLYVLNLGQYKFSYDYKNLDYLSYIVKLFEGIFVENIFGGGEYVWLTIDFNKHYPLKFRRPYIHPAFGDEREENYKIIGLFNKLKDDFSLVAPSNVDDQIEPTGIENDIDGGINFMPKYAVNDTLLFGWFEPYQLKMYVSSESFKNSTPKYPEKKKELEELAASLDENDNPVLMLVKLKE